LIGKWRVSDAAIAEPYVQVQQIPPPLAFRTDAMGIFAILGLTGVASLVIGTPSSIEQIVPPWASIMWAVSLTAFGGLGFVATLCPRRLRVYGLAVEAMCRTGLALAPLVYSSAIIGVVGIKPRLATVIVFCGISAINAVAAVLIFRWLRKQQRLVVHALRNRGEGE